MNKSILFLICLLYSCTSFSQYFITLQPGPGEGKDAKVWSNEPDSNFGDELELKANAWTWSGVPGIERAFLAFNIYNIPPNAEICYAKLSLYATVPWSSQTNSQLSGSNETILRRVVEYWDEHEVTWNTQPATSELHAVVLPVSVYAYEDLVEIDVTDLVKDMISDPFSFGFAFQLQTEEHYRRRIFATSDTEDPTHYPKLEICYNIDEMDVQGENNNAIHVTPNPFQNALHITFPATTGDDPLIIIQDMSGHTFYQKAIPAHDISASTLDLTDIIPAEFHGLCILSITSEGKKYIRKLVKE